MLAEYADPAGKPRARYVYAGNQRIAMIDSLNHVYYYLNDHLGSAAVVIDSAGSVKDKYKYHPFGRVPQRLRWVKIVPIFPVINVTRLRKKGDSLIRHDPTQTF